VQPGTGADFPLPTAQVTTLTPPAAITGFATAVKQLTDGHNVAIINGKTVKSAAVDINATGTVISAVALKKIKVFAVKLILSAPLSLNFRSGATSLLEGPMPMTANSGYVESVTPPMFLFCTAVAENLDLVILGAGTVSGRISYWDDDAT